MRITIIIPAYNEERTIGKTISSIQEVMDSLGAKYEIVVVDDGSADNTFFEAAKKASNNVIILRKENGGKVQP